MCAALGASTGYGVVLEIDRHQDHRSVQGESGKSVLPPPTALLNGPAALLSLCLPSRANCSRVLTLHPMEKPTIGCVVLSAWAMAS